MPPTDLRTRTFLVTGANSGIGRALAEALAARGARVILAARSAERTTPVVTAIRERYPDAKASFLPLDLADFGSVRRAAAQLLDAGQGVDVLVNNAGVAGTRSVSRDGYDLTYAVNHLGHFLLTNLLLPRLRESTDGRIVNVASVAHVRVKQFDWSVLSRREVPARSGFNDYAVTKLMNVLHAKELARRLAGTTVTAYSVHPGAVASNIWRALPGPLQWALKLFMISNEEGAATPLHCATAPRESLVSGAYYVQCREARANRLADDAALAAELWARSEAATAG
jgi:dehydrogenase/reductase SDR family protein 13